MRTILAALFLCFATSAKAFGPECATDPLPHLLRTTVMLERMFDKDERYFDQKEFKWVEGIQGTAWFVDKQTIATIGHVATSAKLDGSWKEVTLAWSDGKDEETSLSLKVRVQLKDIIVGPENLEPIMTLELEIPIDDAFVAPIRYTPLQNKEAVVGLGYRDGALRFAHGYLNYPKPSSEPSDSDPPPKPYLPFELFDADESKNDRYVFDHGASGSPLFDCDGNVVAVVQAMMEWPFPAGKVFGRTTTTSAWGDANMTGVSTANMGKQK